MSRTEIYVSQKNILKKVWVIIKIWAAVWAVSGRVLSLIPDSDRSKEMISSGRIPGLFQTTGFWNTGILFCMTGLFLILFLIQEKGDLFDKRTHGHLNLLCLFLALCMVFGKSYYETGTWNYIFFSGLQFALSVFVMFGYAVVFKSVITLFAYLVKNHKGLLRSNCRGKIETFLFGTDKKAFWALFFLIVILALPYLIFFFPGTLEDDGIIQLWQTLGARPMTGHHPVGSTKVMGFAMSLGIILCSSNTIGLFFYTITQFLIQAFSFTYTIHLLNRMKAPLILRWFSLFFFAVLPLFPMWGYTMVKDSSYYICTLLFAAALVDILMDFPDRSVWWKTLLFLLGALGMVLSRNNGRYVVGITLLCGCVLYKKYWKQFLTGFLICCLAIFLVEGVYMPVKNIPPGPVKEMLSIPLQQTARYMREHGEDITVEEKEILQAVFECDMEQLGEKYDPEISDPVKDLFVDEPGSVLLRQYFGVWFRQFMRHPDTYFQAFFHHTYGYFYPDREEKTYPLCIFRMLYSDTEWKDAYLDLKFGIEDPKARYFLEGWTEFFHSLPFIGMLYSCGMHTWIMIGCLTGLIVGRRKKEILVLAPSILTLMVCVASPVNGHLRYMLPIVVLLPLNLAWCCQQAAKGQNTKKI